ncbi:MAG: hypothetical protein Q4G30_04025 [Actinomycetaceae bacterium]|nr:hypothetical protein [Actinomycetaceae bacterium]
MARNPKPKPVAAKKKISRRMIGVFLLLAVLLIGLAIYRLGPGQTNSKAKPIPSAEEVSRLNNDLSPGTLRIILAGTPFAGVDLKVGDPELTARFLHNVNATETLKGMTFTPPACKELLAATASKERAEEDNGIATGTLAEGQVAVTLRVTSTQDPGQATRFLDDYHKLAQQCPQFSVVGGGIDSSQTGSVSYVLDSSVPVLPHGSQSISLETTTEKATDEQVQILTRLGNLVVEVTYTGQGAKTQADKTMPDVSVFVEKLASALVNLG